MTPAEVSWFGRRAVAPLIEWDIEIWSMEGSRELNACPCPIQTSPVDYLETFTMVSFISSFMPSTSSQPSSGTEIRSKVSSWLAPIVYPLGCRIVIPGYFGSINVSGQHHLPTEGPVILAPTHRARWDALLVPYAAGRRVTGRDLRFMVTANEMTGIQGWFIRRLGGFPVNPKQPAIASLRFGLEVLQSREPMVIFPEGGIFRDGKLHPLKPGLARLALQAELSQPGLGVQIVPISLDYEQPYPEWGCDVTIRIGQPLRVSNYCQPECRDVTKQNARRLTQALASALQDLGAEPVADPAMQAIAL